MRTFLGRARADGYAVPAFNIVDELTACTAVAAAVEAASPVILQTSVKTVRHYGPRRIARWLDGGAPGVPVALHLDHCRDREVIAACLDAGWTDVMFDGSHLPPDRNAAETRAVVEMAAAYGAGVEGELGVIAGVEEEVIAEQSMLTDPDTARRFVAETGIDYMAPAIGTAHGEYPDAPVIDFSRLKAIVAAVPIPVVIHGGTGLDDETYRALIRAGGAKINISTGVKTAFLAAWTQAVRDADGEPLTLVRSVEETMAARFRTYMDLFGSAGVWAGTTTDK